MQVSSPRLFAVFCEDYLPFPQSGCRADSWSQATTARQQSQMKVGIDDATFKHVLPVDRLRRQTEYNLACVRQTAQSQKLATASRKLRNQAERIIPLSGVTVSIAGSEVPVIDEESASLLQVIDHCCPETFLHHNAGWGYLGEWEV